MESSLFIALVAFGILIIGALARYLFKTKPSNPPKEMEIDTKYGTFTVFNGWKGLSAEKVDTGVYLFIDGYKVPKSKYSVVNILEVTNAIETEYEFQHDIT